MRRNEMKINNEKGYTLVLVLLIITLIMIFSLTLISNVLNSTAQNNKIEEKIQTERLEEMGKLYFQKVIQKKIDDFIASQPDNTELDEAQLNAQLSTPIVFPIDTNTDFHLTTIENGITYDSVSQTVQIKYQISIGGKSTEKTTTMEVQ